MKKSSEHIAIDIVNNLPGLVMRYQLRSDQTDEIIFANRAASSLFLPKSKSRLEAPTFWAMVHPEDSALLHQSFFSSAEKLTQWEFEWRVKTDAGSIIWLWGTGNPARQKDGSTVWDCIISDITSRKAVGETSESLPADHTLREDSERLLSLLINKTEESFLLLNKDLRVVNYNDQFLREFDSYMRKVVKEGDLILDFVTPELRKPLEELYSRVLQGQEESKEFSIPVETELFHFQVKYNPVPDESGSIVGVFVTTKDITERKRAEEQLALNNSLFRSLVENGADAVIIIGPDGTPTYVSPSITRVLGYTEEEALTLNMFELIHPDDVDGVVQKMEEVMANPGITIPGNTSRTRHKDGSWRWMEASITNMLHDPIINGIVDNFRDVTEQKELQDLLRNASELAKIGSWEIDLIKQSVYWSDVTKKIREAEPDFESDLDTGISYFKEGDREIIESRVKECIENGTPWDEELQITTFKGNSKWVRTIGRAEFSDGKCIRIYGSFQDIDENKIAHLDLLKFKQVIENSHDGIALANPQGKTIYLNPAMEETLGHTVESLQQANGSISVYSDPGKLEEVFSELLSGGYWKGDVELLNKHKQPINFHLSGGPIFNDSGQLMAIYGIHTDISERIQAEQRLKAAFEEKNQILESIGDAFFATDRNFTVTYWNRLAETLTETPREKILGKNLWDVFGDAITLSYYENYHRALNEMVTVNFVDYYKPVNKWFEVSAYPSESGLTVYFRDVTERNKTQEAILQSNDRFKKVSEATNDAIWDWDIISDTLFWGEGFKTLFGHEMKENQSSSFLWSKNIHPDDLDDVLASLFDVLETNSTNKWEKEYRYLRSNGTYAFVIDRGMAIRDAEGKATRMVGAMTDITHRKEYEESLKILNENLEKQAKDLAISNAELEQFAYVASHDLQEPLRMVTSFLTRLENKYDAQLDEKAHQYIHFAVDGAKRMRQIILDLLQFSRVGRHEDDLEVIEVQEIVAEVVTLQKKIIEEKQANISIGDLPTLQTFRSPLLQIFHNLISNALKYTQEGRPSFISITCYSTNTHWQFSVEDNGIGIEPEYCDQIFIIFQRLHQKEEYGGTGIGLAIVKKIIDNMGGKIWVESVPGEGSAFYFTLPK
ncbi:MAG: PAS domain S-box protein [Marinoscillum sp.]|uniref:PAS domain S-box protein n=2 Tax=Marinoscillum sp. TaxID=2024838 RepID=UPI0032FC449E